MTRGAKSNEGSRAGKRPRAGMTRNRERGERKREGERKRDPVGGIFGEQRGGGYARSARRAVSRGLRTRNPRAMPIFAHAR